MVATLGPPLTIATALMFYFGWARAQMQASVMGLDVSLFDYSTQDYVLMSISTLFLPLLAIAALALGWLALHRRVVGALVRPAALRRLQQAGRATMGVGTLAVAATLLTAVLDRNAAPLFVPLVLAAGTAVAAYGAWLAGAARTADAPLPVVPPWQRALHALLVGSVIGLALFWEVSTYAGIVGRGYAQQIASGINQRPSATVFSPTPLGIQAPGVREEEITPGPDADPDAPVDAFRYRTTGLRLLVRSGERLFLLHDGWTAEDGTVVVLPDTDELRWQFSR